MLKKLFARVLADGAELVIDMDESTISIGHCHDRVLVDGLLVQRQLSFVSCQLADVTNHDETRLVRTRGADSIQA